MKNKNKKIVPPINLLKMKFTFDKRWYEKYDMFKLGNTEYICSSRPKENDDGNWVIEVIPTNIMPIQKTYETTWIGNALSELYDTN